MRISAISAISVSVATTFLISSGTSWSSDVPLGSASEQAAGHITGVGGVFFKAKDPKALAAWYRDVLGLPIEVWGGAALRYDAPKHPPALGWNAFPASTKYFAPSTSSFMINYAVDNMDAILARLQEKRVKILTRSDDDPNGRFVWILDPEDNKIELWEPKLKVAQ